MCGDEVARMSTVVGARGLEPVEDCEGRLGDASSWFGGGLRVAIWRCAFGEKEGKEVRDLSEAAMDEAELEGCEVFFLDLDGRTVPDRWLFIDVADCCEIERSRGTVTADSESIASCQITSWSYKGEERGSALQVRGNRPVIQGETNNRAAMNTTCDEGGASKLV